MNKNKMKFVKSMHIGGNTFDFYSFKKGIYLEINKMEVPYYYVNMRDAINCADDYNISRGCTIY